MKQADRQAAAPRLEMARLSNHKTDAQLENNRFADMPSLFRFLTIIAIVVAVVYAAMFALAQFVEPKQGEISVRVPLDIAPQKLPAVPETQ